MNVSASSRQADGQSAAASSKRRNGMLKKAKEINVLCDARVSAIIFGSSGKMHEFFSSPLVDILDQYHKLTGKRFLGSKSYAISHIIGRRIILGMLVLLLRRLPKKLISRHLNLFQNLKGNSMIHNLEEPPLLRRLRDQVTHLRITPPVQHVNDRKVSSTMTGWS
nr:Type II (MIKC) MADS-box transcription factor [Ipomoea batatas]